MDGRGRAFDNIFFERLWRRVKHEDIYLKVYGSMSELTLGLTEYFAFYNNERLHQSLGYKTPNTVYQSAMGGGALIVDKFGAAAAVSPVPLRSTGDTTATKADTTETKIKQGQRCSVASENESIT